MKYEDAAEMVEELTEDEVDDFAIWLSFEDQNRLYDTQPPIRYDDDGVKGVEVRGDPEITSPQLLSKNVDDIPDDTVLHDPPLGLVEQLIEPERKDMNRGLKSRAAVRDRLFYEVEKVAYRFSLDAIEGIMELSEIHDLMSRVGDGRWDIDLSPHNELVFTREPEPGTEYTDQAIVIELESAPGAPTVDEQLEHMRPVQRLAAYGRELIDSQQSREISERVERRVETEDAPMQVVEDEGDVLDQDLTFETTEDEVVIGEKIVVLGGLYMTRSPDV